MIQGLDAGSPQGVISLLDWRKIRSEGRRFAFLRCAEGTGGVDSTFASNVAGARMAGLAIGPYLVLHPWLDVGAQVTSWRALSKGLGTGAGDLAPVIDIELDHTSALTLTPAQVLAALIECASQMAISWGRPPIVYTYPDYERRDILGGGDASPLASTTLWLAAYAAQPPKAPAPWSSITFWQDSGGNKYRTPAGAPCDDDQFLGDEAAFADACNPNAQRVVASSTENA